SLKHKTAVSSIPYILHHINDTGKLAAYIGTKARLVDLYLLDGPRTKSPQHASHAYRIVNRHTVKLKLVVTAGTALNIKVSHRQAETDACNGIQAFDGIGGTRALWSRDLCVGQS